MKTWENLIKATEERLERDIQGPKFEKTTGKSGLKFCKLIFIVGN